MVGFVDKLIEQPAVTGGCLLTTAMLVGGLASFRKGNAQRSQQMMRARVVMQGLTLVVITSILYTQREQNNSKLQASLSPVPPPAPSRLQ